MILDVYIVNIILFAFFYVIGKFVAEENKDMLEFYGLAFVCAVYGFANSLYIEVPTASETYTLYGYQWLFLAFMIFTIISMIFVFFDWKNSSDEYAMKQREKNMEPFIRGEHYRK